MRPANNQTSSLYFVKSPVAPTSTDLFFKCKGASKYSLSLGTTSEQRVGAWKNGAISIAGLTTLRWRLDNSHVEQLQQALGHFWQSLNQNPRLPYGILRFPALILWTPNQWAFQHSLAFQEFWFVWYQSLLISRFEHGHFTLAQTVEKLRLDEALNIIWAWNEACQSKCQTLENCKFKLSTQVIV